MEEDNLERLDLKVNMSVLCLASIYLSCCDFSIEIKRKSKRLEKIFKMNLSGERLVKAIVATTVVIQMGIPASVCGVRSQKFTVLIKALE